MTSPETVRLWAFDTVKRDTRIPLTCPVHDRPYEQTLERLSIGKNGCGECNGHLPWSERVPELMKKIEKRRYTLDETQETEASLKRGLEKDGCYYKLKLICPNEHAYYSGTVDRFTGKRQSGCMTCAGTVPWSKRVDELMDIISGRGYTLDESQETEASLKKGLEKDHNTYKLKLICPNGHKYYSGIVATFTGKNHRGCMTCAGNVPWSKRVPELKDIISGRGYTLDESQETEASLKKGLEKDRKKYKLKLICPNGHAYYSGIVSTFTGKNQSGCMTCFGNVPWSKRVPELMDIISGREYTLDESQETEASLKKGLEKKGALYKLKLICPNGHAYSSGIVATFTGKNQTGCSTCTDPRTEKLVREWLDEQFSDKFQKVRPDFLLYPETGRNLELDLFCTRTGS